jgi:hypothetical protein
MLIVEWFQLEVAHIRSEAYPDDMSTEEKYDQLKRAAKDLQSKGQLRGLTSSERADWAYGNAAIENSDVTREMADRAVATYCDE